MNVNMKSMEEKLDVRLVSVGLFSLVLTAVVFLSAFHTLLQRQVWQDLDSECAQIAAAYEYLPGADALRTFADEHLRLTLIDAEGNVLFESAEVQITENHLTRPEVQQALSAGQGQDMRDSATLGYDTYYFARLLPDGNVLRVAREAAGVSGVYGEVLPPVLVCCVLILLVSVVLSALLTRQLVRPILRMTDDLDHLPAQAPYRELQPFVQALAADRQLRDNNARIRQEFTANVSHELKTPLTSISGYAELIENGMAKPEDMASFAGKIHREAQRMIRLVSDIIRLSELETNNEKSDEAAPEFGPVDLLSVARSCAESLTGSAQKAFVSLHAEGTSTFVQGNADMLEELCYNLCDNAIRYNRPGGRVTVRVGTAGETPFLKVVDNGIGIPSESQPRVFERFYRVDKSRSKATGGTGLGLAIVKHIAQVHGARLHLQSEEGKGTEVEVLFG